MQGKMGDVKRTSLYFIAPRQVELREETLPAPGPDEVLVESTCSAISAGTELLIYQGHFPRDAATSLSANLAMDSVISSLRDGLQYPLSFGYASAGIVRETGKDVDPAWRDKRVFAFQPHVSHFIAKPETLFLIPADLNFETACFLPNMETAVNLVQDAAPILGERVLVFGQGVVGLLTASLLVEFPLDMLVTADCYALRRETSLELNVNHSLDPHAETFQHDVLELCRIPHPKNPFAYAQREFDLTFELSGNPTALNDAIALTCFGGRVVVGSWYGEKSAELDLGGAFHRSRIKLIASQVSTIAPELSGRWDKARRFDVAWKALTRIQPEKWITHRFRLAEANTAYRLLDERPQETIQILITYP
jgi:2-desacetyl-2-hydroxyethyl bacteriochlorophyllide A dehydrogenase